MYASIRRKYEDDEELRMNLHLRLIELCNSPDIKTNASEMTELYYLSLLQDVIDFGYSTILKIRLDEYAGLYRHTDFNIETDIFGLFDDEDMNLFLGCPIMSKDKFRLFVPLKVLKRSNGETYNRVLYTFDQDAEEDAFSKDRIEIVKYLDEEKSGINMFLDRMIGYDHMLKSDYKIMQLKYDKTNTWLDSLQIKEAYTAYKYRKYNSIQSVYGELLMEAFKNQIDEFMQKANTYIKKDVDYDIHTAEYEAGKKKLEQEKLEFETYKATETEKLKNEQQKINSQQSIIDLYSSLLEKCNKQEETITKLTAELDSLKKKCRALLAAFDGV